MKKSVISFTLDIDFQEPSVIAKRKRSYNRCSLFSWGSPVVLVMFFMTLQLSNTANIYGEFTMVIFHTPQRCPFSMIPFIFTCKITCLAGNEHNCGLSFPARYYVEVTPVLSSLLFVTIALTRTVVAKNQQVQISISPPLPLLPFDRRPPPWYKFLSLLMALAFRCCKKQRWQLWFSPRKYWAPARQNYDCSAG